MSKPHWRARLASYGEAATYMLRDLSTTQRPRPAQLTRA